MTPENKDTIRRALENYRGDDFERATAAFRGFTPGQMMQEHGQSGQTRMAILAGYEAHVRRVERAQKALEALP